MAIVYDENGKTPLITGVGVWNEEKNFSLEMPLALHDDFIIAENEDSVVFGNDKGTLFTIRIRANDGEIVKGDDFIMSENRYKQLLKATSPENAEALFTEAEENAKKRMDFYKKIGEIF